MPSCRTIPALKSAIRIVGSQSALARRMGGAVKQAHVYYWLHNGVPLSRARAIWLAIGKRVPLSRLTRKPC